MTALELSHEMIRAVVRTGDTVVDATAGNGHDTVFLAGLAGPAGRVHAFDVQTAAVEATRARLAAAGLAAEVHACGHEQAGAVLDAAGVKMIRAAMFNLGWLPGGDKTRVTQPGTTLAALEALLPRLEAGGRVTLVLYVGHPGGAEEERAIAQWAAALDPGVWSTWHYQRLNLPLRPRLVMIERTS